MAKAKKGTPKVQTPKAVAPSKAVKPAAKIVAPKSSSSNAVFNIDEINALIHAVNNSNVSKLKLEKGDFKITISQGGSSAVAPQIVHTVAAPIAQPVAMPATVAAPAPAPAAPAAAPAADAANDNLITIKSPMIGTFYRSAGPGKPTFVNVGDDIQVGQVLCIVEAMKLFNEIESEHSGKIVKVLVDDSSPVEYDQPLFLIQP